MWQRRAMTVYVWSSVTSFACMKLFGQSRRVAGGGAAIRDEKFARRLFATGEFHSHSS
jgi:hypothetical protein